MALTHALPTNLTLRPRGRRKARSPAAEPFKFADRPRKGSDYQFNFTRNCKVRFTENVLSHTH